jgi:ring-1,2-phenylacetyl-CoA epoxidase subunit PaaC
MSDAQAAAGLTPATRDALAELLLTIADDEFVIGFWDSEWTGIAPILEEDVATSSISQDEIGHARALYELLAELTDDDADRIAFGREPDAFRHAALLNHPRTDWAFSVARRYQYETCLLYTTPSPRDA